MHQKRRSGRIAKELPIVLLGTDTTGKVFAEETKTVVLSRHGAGVLSKYRFTPDEVLSLRLSGSAKEAEVRLVGQIGGEPGRYVYGLAFVDPDLEFWPMEFPAPEDFAPASRPITLECTFCHARLVVEHHEIEEDVYSVNGNILRYCSDCGISTPWSKARGEASSTGNSIAANGDTPARVPVATTALGDSSAQIRTAAIPGSAAIATEVKSNAYSGATMETLPAGQIGALCAPESRAEAGNKAHATASAPAGRPLDPHGRPINRRKHMRVRVDFSACIRRPQGGEEIVECENVSKGGLCFHSRKRYAVGEVIEVAAPFSPGEPALFVLAKIRRGDPVGDGQLFRYGVAYLESTSARSI